MVMEILSLGENVNGTRIVGILSINPFDVHRIIFHTQFAIKTNTMTRNDCMPHLKTSTTLTPFASNNGNNNRNNYSVKITENDYIE